MKLVVVQPLLPHYSIAFFNRVVDMHPDLELVLLADIETREALNQYQPQDCRFTVHHLRSVQRRGLIFRPGLLRLLRQENPDVTVFNANPREISQLCGMVVSRLLGRRFTAWGMFHRIGGPRPATNGFYRLAGRLADRCLTYTRTGASNLISLGVPKHKIGIVGTAIDERIPFAERAASTPEELADFRREQGLEGRHVVLQVVRLSRLKRPELLVEAARILLRQRQDLLFVLIGDGDMRQELEGMVASSGLQHAFRFIGAVYDEAVLSRWYLCADVFVVPTCIGLSAHHAMSYGVPVVTDDSLDSQASEFDIIADGLNALTYREGDVQSLADAITSLTTDAALRATLAINALRTIELRHNVLNKALNFLNSNTL